MFLFPFTSFTQERDTSRWNPYYSQAFHLLVETGEYEESIRLSQLALDLYKQEAGLLDSMVAESYMLMGEGYYNMEDYESAIIYFEKQGNVFRQSDNVPPSLIANNFNNIGFCYEARGDYKLALNSYERSIPLYKIAKHKFAPKNLLSAYNNMAICYNQMGNLQKGLQFFEKTLQSELEIYRQDSLKLTKDISLITNKDLLRDKQKSLLRKKSLSLASTYNNMGLTYKGMQDFEKALELLNQSLELRTKYKDKNVYRMARLYGNIGMSYFEKKDYQKALDNCEEDFLLKLQKTSPTDLVMATPLVNVGKCHRELNHYQKARRYLKQALDLRLPAFGPYHHYVIAVQVELAKLELKEKQYDASIQRMADIIDGLQGEKAVNEFKDLEKPLVYLKVLTQKGEAHVAKYNNSKNPKDLEEALAMNETALDLIDFIRMGLDEKASKEVLLGEHYDLYGKTINVYYQLWQASQNKAYLSKAFEVSEKGKSALLLEAVKTTYATTFAGIPTDLLEKEAQLKVDIAYTEKQRFEAKSDKDTKAVHQLANELFDLKIAYQKLIERFEKDYPAYYQLKYNTTNTTIAAIQQQFLDKETTMLSYFIAEDDLFTFVLNKSDIRLYKQAIEIPLAETVFRFVESIKNHPIVGKKDKTTLENIYVDEAYGLYQFLIEPVENQLQEKLIIIPHNLLAYIPFECLLQQRPEQAFAFRTHAYLLHNYQMSYTYSANLLQEMYANKSQTAKKEFIGFAPAFPSNKSQSSSTRLAGLGALSMNVPEVEMIQEILGGDIFIDTAATEERFVAKAGDYQIIHLATHGIANDKAGDFCYLAFTEQKDSIENEILYVKELYPLRLEADMVVLSACETATGELKKGEGMVSIARGFSYAGAKSIITTLWSINDETTAYLMEYFYENIRTGNPKDIALRKAQQSFISKSRNQMAHPVYWAAFIPVGNMEAIQLGGLGFSNLGMLGIGLLLGLLGFWWWRRT